MTERTRDVLGCWVLLVALALLPGTALLAVSACAQAGPTPPAETPADGVQCYWSTHHNLCLCSGNWHDQNPSLVLTGAKTAKACL